MPKSGRPGDRQLRRGVVLRLCSVILFCTAASTGAQVEPQTRAAIQDSIRALRIQARYDDARDLAENLVQAASRDSTARTFEITNDRLLLATMTMAAGLSPQDQIALAEADGLGPQVTSLIGQAQFDQAEDLAKKRVETYEHLLGADHQEVAASLDDLGQLCYNQGQYPEAEQLFRRSATIKENALGPDHPDLASSLINLATVFRRQGLYAQAEPLYNRALAIEEKSLGPDHPEVAACLNNLGELYRIQGLYAQAEPRFERSLMISESALGADHPSVAVSLNNLAAVYFNQGRYAQAEPYFIRALEINEKTRGGEHPDVASTLYNLAKLYATQGQYTLAEPLYRRSLAIWEAVLGPDHPNVADNLNNLAAVYYNQAQYAKAEPLFKRALTVYENTLGPDHVAVAAGLNNLAALYGKLGQYAQVEQLYRHALSIYEKTFGPDHPNVAMSLSNLATLYSKQDKYMQAQTLVERALKIWEKALGPEHPDVAATLNTLARLYDQEGRYAQAEPVFLRALEIWEKSFGPDHPDVAVAVNNLASVYFNQGQYAKAEPLFERAFAIRERVLGPDHPEVVDSLVRSAKTYLATGNQDRAATTLVGAATRYETARLRVSQGIARATFQESPYPALAVASIANGAPVQAWPAMEKTCGRALAELLVAARKRPLTEAESAHEDSLARSVNQLEPRLKVLIETAHADSAAESEQRVQATRLELLAADAAWSEFRQALAQKYPISEGQSFPLERVQATLGDKQVIIGWLDYELKRGEYHSWAYAVRNNGPVTWVQLPGQAATDTSTPFDEAEICHNALRRAGDSEGAVGAFSAARIQPLLGALEGIDDLIVIPAGVMATVPVEALVDDQGRRLVDRFTVSYAPSATIYAWLQEKQKDLLFPADRQAVNGRTFLLGDPPFTSGQRDAMMAEVPSLALAPVEAPDEVTLRGAVVGDEDALDTMPRLRNSRREVLALADLAGESAVLLGPEASEQEIVRRANSGDLGTYRIIHLATHALVDQERPERSCLVLSRVDLPDAYEAAKRGDRIYDGRLTVQEILQEWKLNADLVTLSACETGLGQNVQGEGLVGFAHALLQAGARSLVLSLWKVDDRATARFMERFYENLWRRQMDKAAALREAKQWLLTYEDETGERPYESPRYWAAFVLVGDRG